MSEGLCGEAAVPSKAQMPGLSRGSHSLFHPPPPLPPLCWPLLQFPWGCLTSLPAPHPPLPRAALCLCAGDGSGGTRKKETETEDGPREAFLTKQDRRLHCRAPSRAVPPLAAGVLLALAGRGRAADESSRFLNPVACFCNGEKNDVAPSPLGPGGWGHLLDWHFHLSSGALAGKLGQCGVSAPSFLLSGLT